MKNILKIITILFILSACGQKQVEDIELSIVSPSGAPALAFYTEIGNEKFNTADAKSILPELKGNNGSDVIVIDTVNGIKLLNDGANYKLAATITFGNFYIAATGNDDNGVMDDGDYIVVFSQGATPDLVFHYIFGDSLDSNLHYVNAVADALATLIKGININDENKDINEEPYVDYVMIAQPALTAAMAQNENVSIYANVQELYTSKSNTSMIQASVFVSNRLSNQTIKNYLESLKNNIEELINNPDLFSQVIMDNGLDDTYVKDLFGVPNTKIASKVLKDNSIGLGFKYAIDIKQDIDNFVSVFGVGETSEEIYYK